MNKLIFSGKVKGVSVKDSQSGKRTAEFSVVNTKEQYRENQLTEDTVKFKAWKQSLVDKISELIDNALVVVEAHIDSYEFTSRDGSPISGNSFIVDSIEILYNKSSGYKRVESPAPDRPFEQPTTEDLPF